MNHTFLEGLHRDGPFLEGTFEGLSLRIPIPPHPCDESSIGSFIASDLRHRQTAQELWNNCYQSTIWSRIDANLRYTDTTAIDYPQGLGLSWYLCEGLHLQIYERAIKNVRQAYQLDLLPWTGQNNSTITADDYIKTLYDTAQDIGFHFGYDFDILCETLCGTDSEGNNHHIAAAVSRQYAMLTIYYLPSELPTIDQFRDHLIQLLVSGHNWAFELAGTYPTEVPVNCFTDRRTFYVCHVNSWSPDDAGCIPEEPENGTEQPIAITADPETSDDEDLFPREA